MEAYKERFITEYNQLSERLTKLGNVIRAYHAGTLGFTLTCPIELLEEQHMSMSSYLRALDERAVIEDIDVSGE